MNESEENGLQKKKYEAGKQCTIFEIRVQKKIYYLKVIELKKERKLF